MCKLVIKVTLGPAFPRSSDSAQNLLNPVPSLVKYEEDTLAIIAIIDKAVFPASLMFLAVGLVFEASGFGVFVAGDVGGLLLVLIGIPMFWAGWDMSGARGFPCATASALNMLDAAATMVFWNFEGNPAIRYMGPTLFLVAKIMCSIAIVLYAKFHRDPRRGGLVLSAFFAVIVGWNLGQNILAYLGLRDIAFSFLIGTLLSFAASLIVILALLTEEKLVPKV